MGSTPAQAAEDFTRNWYTYDWRDPQHLDPVGRIGPVATDRYLGTLAGLAAVFPSRMIAAQESSTVAINAVVPDADTTPTPTSAFVSVHYTLAVTDRGKPQSHAATWSLHVIVFHGAWRVDAIAQA